MFAPRPVITGPISLHQPHPGEFIRTNSSSAVTAFFIPFADLLRETSDSNSLPRSLLGQLIRLHLPDQCADSFLSTAMNEWKERIHGREVIGSFDGIYGTVNRRGLRLTGCIGTRGSSRAGYRPNVFLGSSSASRFTPSVPIHPG